MARPPGIMRLSTKAVEALVICPGSQSIPPPSEYSKGRRWDRFDALGRPSPNDRYLRIPDLSNRREPDIADRGGERRSWADSGSRPNVSFTRDNGCRSDGIVAQ